MRLEDVYKTVARISTS